MSENSLSKWLDPETFYNGWSAFLDWLQANLLVPATGIQLLILVGGLVIASFANGPLQSVLAQYNAKTARHEVVRRLFHTLTRQIRLIVWLILISVAATIADYTELPGKILSGASVLLAVWVVTQIASSVVQNRAAAQFVAVIAWSVAALSILGWLEPAGEMLDSVAFSVGDFRLSVLTFGQALASLAIMLWAAIVISKLIERRLQMTADLSPAMQVLLGKLTKISLIIIAVLAGLGIVGIDVTALAVFTGALGFGIGFGMQKVVSNLISGLILLLDKSIKPGDVITIGDTYGWINSMGARYVSLLTRNGIEYLVPNEDLITQQVENWSHSNKLVRQEITFGVSYDADVRKTMELAIEAASETERVLSANKPNCFIIGFGDSSVDFTLRFWLSDPQDGVSNVKGEVFLRLWDKLQEHGIEIPYPQRDLHLRSAKPLPVVMPSEENSAEKAD